MELDVCILVGRIGLVSDAGSSYKPLLENPATVGTTLGTEEIMLLPPLMVLDMILVLIGLAVGG